MRFVHHKKSRARKEGGKLFVSERGIIQSFRRHQQYIDLVRSQLVEHLAPLLRVGGIYRDRAHPGARCGSHLVAHQRQKWGNQDRRPGSPLPQKKRRNEVDSRFTPAGALHHQSPPTVVDQSLDRFELTLVELGILPADERAQDGEGGGVAVGHRPSLSSAPCQRADATASA